MIFDLDLWSLTQLILIFDKDPFTSDLAHLWMAPCENTLVAFQLLLLEKSYHSEFLFIPDGNHVGEEQGAREEVHVEGDATSTTH